MTDAADRTGIDEDASSFRYYRNAVERHWDPAEIDLSADVERVADLDADAFDSLRRTLALFGAGEEAVTEDLSPLAVVLDDVDDQLFVTTQLYEEAKHAEFFHRYWTRVIHAAEDRRGEARSDPRDASWFNDAYDELFERNEAAMERLLTEDTPENRARAYCHYHLTVEGILAQTGYYGVQSSFDGSTPGLPELPGLVEGFSRIRSDEGRHVGFGMRKLKALVAADAVDPSLLHDLTGELAMLVQDAVSAAGREEDEGVTPADLAAYAAEKHAERMNQIVDATADVPDVEALTRLDE
ncbi:ribonucleoside-diphosphate reductase [Halorubellus sp. JP-L1]|uniref:ribonucleotide-diphosphate reductase subunit beta n=1 Tax=Halorubellus sp. JP-L1 TaxID=2715753 RepID=UPI00140BC284|nr:ribonucleotide-diphosphate reductase subunit beta [Halorubellus sp. JP-L1]NHN41979.1 ribonucleoside-diphosphate reductase [Halorubellus sp. JP-L1]